jgi:hypothetical protein
MRKYLVTLLSSNTVGCSGAELFIHASGMEDEAGEKLNQ